MDKEPEDQTANYKPCSSQYRSSKDINTKRLPVLNTRERLDLLKSQRNKRQFNKYLMESNI